RREDPGPHLRRGDGADGRRHVQRERAFRDEPVSGIRVHVAAAWRADRRELLPENPGAAESRSVLAQRRRRDWRAQLPPPPLLLVRDGSPSPPPAAARQPPRPHRPPTHTRLLG